MKGDFKIHVGKGVFLRVPYKLYFIEKGLTPYAVKTILTIEVRLLSFLIFLMIAFFSAFLIAYLVYSIVLLLFAFVIPTFIVYFMFYAKASTLAEEKLNLISLNEHA